MKNAIASSRSAGSALRCRRRPPIWSPNPDFDDEPRRLDDVNDGNGTVALDDDDRTCRLRLPCGSPRRHRYRIRAVLSSCMPVDDSNNVDLFANIDGNGGFAIDRRSTTYSDARLHRRHSAAIASTLDRMRTGGWATYSLDRRRCCPMGRRARASCSRRPMGAIATRTATRTSITSSSARPAPRPATVNVNQEGLTRHLVQPADERAGHAVPVLARRQQSRRRHAVRRVVHVRHRRRSTTNSQRWYSVQSALTGDAQSVDRHDLPEHRRQLRRAAGHERGCRSAPARSRSIRATADRSRMRSTTDATARSRCALAAERQLRRRPARRRIRRAISASRGAWYNTGDRRAGHADRGQPDDAQAFVGWYTYALTAQTAGAAGQRWFSAQSPYTVGYAHDRPDGLRRRPAARSTSERHGQRRCRSARRR